MAIVSVRSTSRRLSEICLCVRALQTGPHKGRMHWPVLEQNRLDCRENTIIS